VPYAAILGFFAFAAVVFWQNSRTERMKLAIAAEADIRREAQAAEAKRWEDLHQSLSARVGGLEANVGKVLALPERVLKLEQEKGLKALKAG
jgi:hypothetical protein